MKMRHAVAILSTLVVGIVIASGIAHSHCEIPCGIYGDKVRIALFYEDIATIEKSMTSIESLTGKSDATSINQVVRWIENKDAHADKIQHTVTQYFMTQRVKPTPAGNNAEFQKYTAQLTALHGMLVHAMKCKQTVDKTHPTHLRQLVDQFAAAYFSKEDLEHIREHHGQNK